MKTLRKLLALALVVAFAATCFVACPAPSNVLVIGATGPLTGDAATYGISVQRGAMIAIEETNAAGGLDGWTFKLEMKDDKAGAVEAETAYNTLLENLGMKVSIGSVTSGAAKAFATAAAQDNILCLSPSASADDVIAVGNHSFRVCFGDPEQATAAANEMVNVKNYTKIGVIYDTSDSYSNSLYVAFEGWMTQNQKVAGTDYVVQSFTKDTKSSFTTQVTALKNAGCDVIFLPIYYTEAGLIAIEAASQGFNVPILGCDGLDGVKDKIDTTVTAGIRYITPFDATSTDEKVASFVSKYKAKYNGETPTQFAADAYDAVMIIYQAMKQNNVSPALSASELTEALKPILTGGTFRYDGLTGAGMTWNAGGAVQKPMQIVVVQ